MRLRHEKQFRSIFSAVEQRKNKRKAHNATMNRIESSEQMTIKQQSDYNVIESLREYNRSQINKISCIENDTALDGDVEGALSLQISDVSRLTEPTGVSKTVDCSVRSIFHLDVVFHFKKILLFLCCYS